MKLSVKVDMSSALKQLDHLKKQVPFAASRAINQTANRARDDIAKELQSNFDRPATFIARGLRVRYSNKSSLTATIGFRDDTGRGGTPDVVMTPNVFGGSRGRKGYERALQSVGAMPRWAYAVPASGADLDALGNIKRSQINRILSWFEAHRPGTKRTNSTVKSRARLSKATKRRDGIAYFAVLDTSKGLTPGIYRRTSFAASGSAIQPVLLFVRSARYRTRLPMQTIVERTVARRFASEFDRALAQAMATAR